MGGFAVPHHQKLLLCFTENIMLDKIQDFFLNKLLGKIAVRLGIALASYAASGKLGLAINMDPREVTALLMAGANAALTWFKHAPVEMPAPAPVEPPKA
jgi:hypothetical protein